MPVGVPVGPLVGADVEPLVGAGLPAGAELDGVPVGAELDGVPVGAELDGVPVGAALGDGVPVGVALGVGELVGSDGEPIVTDCPLFPVVVVVVVPSFVVVVVVVPPEDVVTGQETDLAWMTTPGPKLQVLSGVLLADGALGDGLVVGLLDAVGLDSGAGAGVVGADRGWMVTRRVVVVVRVVWVVVVVTVAGPVADAVG